MKLKNIISIALFLVATVACSMEDEKVFDDMSKAGNTTTSINNNEVALSLKVDMASDFATKADGDLIAPSAEEKAISSISLILLNGSNGVIKAYDGLTVNADNEVVFANNEVVKFLVKMGEAVGYKLMAIANNSGVAFSNTAIYKTLADIQAVTNGNVLGAFPKVGMTTIAASNFTGYTGYDSAADALANDPVFVNINLTQLAARIELVRFTADGYTAGTVAQNFTIDSVVIKNANTKSLTWASEHLDEVNCYVGENSKKEYAGGLTIFTNSVDEDFDYAFGENAPSFYSFRNNAAKTGNAVALKVYYKLGNDVKVSKDITINGGLIEAGNLYRITLNAGIITNNNIEFEATCCVNDWVNNYHEMVMVEK
ncbi:hypothetical protein LJC57_06460 [Parabacteroides sp. OttesenSCG-928-G07]|nr:hypothetical protein [Parabacteroides sp. OttesenSCG-928-G07]